MSNYNNIDRHLYFTYFSYLIGACMMLNNILLCSLLAAYNVDNRMTIEEMVDMTMLDIDNAA